MGTRGRGTLRVILFVSRIKGFHFRPTMHKADGCGTTKVRIVYVVPKRYRFPLRPRSVRSIRLFSFLLSRILYESSKRDRIYNVLL